MAGTRAGALKAWKTIRTNKLKKKRSIAAKKANQTRGAKGRSNAAKKAWQTIRAKTF